MLENLPYSSRKITGSNVNFVTSKNTVISYVRLIGAVISLCHSVLLLWRDTMTKTNLLKNAVI